MAIMTFKIILEIIPWDFFFISERWLKWKHYMAFFEQVFASRALIMRNITAFAGLKIHITGKRSTRSFPGFPVTQWSAAGGNSLNPVCWRLSCLHWANLSNGLLKVKIFRIHPE